MKTTYNDESKVHTFTHASGKSTTTVIEFGPQNTRSYSFTSVDVHPKPHHMPTISRIDDSRGDPFYTIDIADITVYLSPEQYKALVADIDERKVNETLSY